MMKKIKFYTTLTSTAILVTLTILLSLSYLSVGNSTNINYDNYSVAKLNYLDKFYYILANPNYISINKQNNWYQSLEKSMKTLRYIEGYVDKDLLENKLKETMKLAKENIVTKADEASEMSWKFDFDPEETERRKIIL